VTNAKRWWAARSTIIQLLLLIVLAVVLIEAVGLVFGEAVNAIATRVPGTDKILHFSGFALLSLTLTPVVQRWLPGLGSPGLIVSLVLALVAVGDEAGQIFNPARSVDVGDLAAGWCGLAVAGCWRWRRQRPVLAVAVGVTAFAIAAGITMTSMARQRHLYAAVRFERVGDFAGARREYLAAISAGVRTAHVYNQLGWVEIESGVGDPAAAVRYSAQALAMRPNDPDVWDTHGWALHHVGRSAEALGYLERAYAAKPDIFCINYHLGEVLVKLGQIEKARFHYRKQLAFVNTNEAERARKALEELPKP
jgi:VanZ family protein